MKGRLACNTHTESECWRAGQDPVEEANSDSGAIANAIALP